MSRRPGLLTLLLAAALAGPVAAARAADPPAPVPLDTGWTFQPLGGIPSPVTLPHVFSTQTLPELFRGTTASYHLTFTPPPLPPGFAWALRFEQVRRKAAVIVDGQTVAEHSDPYTPLTVRAPRLAPGQPNDLVVDVDNRKGSQPREGWWNWGGITRPVELVPEGPVVLHDSAVLPRVRCDAGGAKCTASVRVDGWAENRTAQPQRARVALQLTPPGGGAATTASATTPVLAPGETRRVTFTTPVRGTPRLWAPGSPSLYSSVIRTTVGSTTAQVDRASVGLRQVSVIGGRVMLNGRRIALRGASIQEDTAQHGAAITDADMDEIVRELKAVHANVTRAQYLLNDRLLSRLDAAGILVWLVSPVYHRDVLLRTPNQRRSALATTSGTILAARNHPSILTFSVGNELSSRPDQTPPTRSYLLDAAKLERDLAPTIPVSADIISFPSLPFERTWRSFDLLGVNSYFGWYPGRPGRETGRLSSLAPYLRRTHRWYPRQSLVMTEFGAEATRAGPASQKQTYAFQTRYLQRNLRIIERLGFMDGAIYFPLRDFAVKPHWDGLEPHPRPDVAVDSIHNKALIAYDGTPKPAFAVAAREFAATPFFVTSPGGPGGGGADVGGIALISGALLALAGIMAFDVWCFRILRRPEPPAFVLRLRREPDGDDVAVRDEVVAAFEA